MSWAPLRHPLRDPDREDGGSWARPDDGGKPGEKERVTDVVTPGHNFRKKKHKQRQKETTEGGAEKDVGRDKDFIAVTSKQG